MTGKEQDCLATDLQPFLFDPNIIDPRVVARDSVDEFDIESIRDISGTKVKNRYVKKDLKFLVHWTGYDDTYDTWDPYEGLRDTEQLHKYLRLHKLTHLIPLKFSANA